MASENLTAANFLAAPATHGDSQTVEHTTQFRVSREQAEAFKALPADLQAKLGPPVYGQVMSVAAIRELAATNSKPVSSTVMCPW